MITQFTDTHIDGLVQDCSNSIVNALELLQPCTKPSIYFTYPQWDSSHPMKYVQGSAILWLPIGFRSRFSQCVDYTRFNEKSFCFRWQETTKLMLFCNTKTSSLVILCDLRYLTRNISSVMTKHMGVQRKLHRFAYIIVQIILCFYS